jgi:hypothetical protein
MEAKLTLTLDKDVIEEARKYAKNINISLSRMVEKYLKSVVNQKREKEIYPTPLVKELSGIIHLDRDADLKEIYSDYLIEKYS